jgi:hypothetical protein
MTAGGQCWELPTLERRTSGTGSGLWVPTPIATEWKGGCGKTGNRAPEKAAKAGLKLGEFAKLWPTPVASDTSSRTKPYAQGGTPLSLAVKWPTPTVCGNYNRKGASATSGDGLATAVRMWPTPTSVSGNQVGRLDEWGGSRSRAVMKTLVTPQELGGALNPTWVEWLMGWPLGWTDLKPLATDKSPSVPLRHGECLQEAES